MIEIQGKAWGTTRTLFENSNVSVHFLQIDKDGYCSEHRHQHKRNLFFVLKGELEIIVWTEEGVEDRTVLPAGTMMTIRPLIFHKFRALTDVECIEVYEARLWEPDIQRRTVGGMKK